MSALLIVAVSAIQAIFGAYGHSQLVAELESNFSATQQATLNRIAHSSATPLWEVNSDALDDILRAELANTDILAIRIRDKAGDNFAALERDPAGKIVPAGKDAAPAGLRLGKPIILADGPGQAIGHIAIHFTRGKIDHAIDRSAIRQIWPIIAIDGAVVVLLLLGLNLVFRPLGQLRDALMILAGSNGGGGAEIRELSVTRLILSSVNEGIAGLGIEGTLTFINAAGAAMLGYEVDDLIGQPMHAMLHHTRPRLRPRPKRTSWPI